MEPGNRPYARQVKIRHLILCLTAAILPLGLGACSKDDAAKDVSESSKKAADDGPKSAETTVPGNDGGADDPSAETTAPADAPLKPFAESIEAAQKQLESSRGDLCALDSFAQELGNITDPKSTKEAEVAVNLVADYFRALAETAPPQNTSDAAALNAAADKLVADSAAVGFDLEKMSTIDPFSYDGVGPALSNFTDATKATCNQSPE